MKEIGATLGVVESRVSQIHSSAVLRMRAALGAPMHRSQRSAKTVARVAKKAIGARRDADSTLDQGCDRRAVRRTGQIPVETLRRTGIVRRAAFQLRRCAGQISNEQMRAISVVNDHFARNHACTRWAHGCARRPSVSARRRRADALWRVLIARIPEPAYVGLLRLEPLGAVGSARDRSAAGA